MIWFPLFSPVRPSAAFKNKICGWCSFFPPLMMHRMGWGNGMSTKKDEEEERCRPAILHPISISIFFLGPRHGSLCYDGGFYSFPRSKAMRRSWTKKRPTHCTIETQNTISRNWRVFPSSSFSWISLGSSKFHRAFVLLQTDRQNEGNSLSFCGANALAKELVRKAFRAGMKWVLAGVASFVGVICANNCKELQRIRYYAFHSRVL